MNHRVMQDTKNHTIINKVASLGVKPVHLDHGIATDFTLLAQRVEYSHMPDWAGGRDLDWIHGWLGNKGDGVYYTFHY